MIEKFKFSPISNIIGGQRFQQTVTSTEEHRNSWILGEKQSNSENSECIV
jgi:hypothetical protein